MMHVLSKIKDKTFKCVLHIETMHFCTPFTLSSCFYSLLYQPNMIKMQFQPASLLSSRKRECEMGRKVEPISQSIFYSIVLFILHWRHEENNTDIQLFIYPSSSAVKPPRIPEDNPIESLVQQPHQNNISVTFFYSIAIIPSALLSPITLCHVPVSAICTLP